MYELFNKSQNILEPVKNYDRNLVDFLDVKRFSKNTCHGYAMQFLSRESCNFKIARVNQVRFSVRFVAAISQGFRTCLKLNAILLRQKLHRRNCRDKNRLCKLAFTSV